MKKIIKENDSYRGPEYHSFEEFERFKAEDFKSSEVVKQTMEAYKSEEVKKISFVDEIFGKKKKKKDDKLAEKLKQTSTNSVKISSSMGGVGTVIVTGVVGAAVVLGPTLGIIQQETPTSQPPVPIAPVVGTFEVERFKVDKNDELLNTVYIYFDETKLNEGYYPRIKDPLSTEEKYIDLSQGENTFVIEGLEDNLYNLQVDIFDINETKLIESQNIEINTTCDYPYISETLDSNYLLTYNTDGTTNFYYRTHIDEIVDSNTYKEVQIFNDLGEELDYQVNEIDKFVEVLDVKEEKYSLEEKVYYKQGKGEYLIHKSSSPMIDLTPNNVEITATQSKAYVKVEDSLVSDIEVIIFYNDYNYEHRVMIPKEKQGEVVEVEFDTPSENVDIDVRYQMNNFSTFETEIPFTYKGLAEKTIRESQNFKFELKSELDLKRVEFCSDSLNGIVDTLTLKFDGYLLSNEYLGVEITDSNGNVLYSLGYTQDVTSPIEIQSLPMDEELTITYMSYYEETQNPDYDPDSTDDQPYDGTYAINTFVNSMDITIETNSYSDLLDNGSVFFSPISAYDYYLTVNENDKLNAYGDVQFRNDTTEDLYLLTNMMNNFTEEVINSYKTNTEHVEFLDIGSNDKEPIEINLLYTLFIDKGNVSYNVSPTITADGTFANVIDGKYQLGYSMPYMQDTVPTTYLLAMNYEIVSDVYVNLMEKSTTDLGSYVIPLSDIEYPESGVVTIDLSSYSSESYITVSVSAKIDLNSSLTDISFLDSFNVEGITQIEAVGSADIYL